MKTAPPRAADPMLELDRLTAAGEIAPLPNPGSPSLRAQWRQMLRGGKDSICLRQLRLRRKKAAGGAAPAEEAASEGLRLLRRQLVKWCGPEFAYVVPEDSVHGVWEAADGDDGMLWGVSIAMALADELGDFTEEELKTWNNLDGTVADLAALLERIHSEHRPPPPPRPRLTAARLFGFLLRLVATVGIVFLGELVRLCVWRYAWPRTTYSGITPPPVMAANATMFVVLLFAFVLLMRLVWGWRGGRIACVLCGGVALLFAIPIGVPNDWIETAIALSSLVGFALLFRRFKARSSTAPSAPPPTKK